MKMAADKDAYSPPDVDTHATAEIGLDRVKPGTSPCRVVRRVSVGVKFTMQKSGIVIDNMQYTTAVLQINEKIEHINVYTEQATDTSVGDTSTSTRMTSIIVATTNPTT